MYNLISFIKSIFILIADRYSFFLKLLYQHIYLTLISISIISVAGITIGIIITRHKKSAKIILAFVSFIYTIPSIALFGFLVSITGIGNKSAIIALVLYGLLPVIRNTYTGIMEVDPMLIEVSTALGSTDRQILWRIQFPLALPVIITGLRIMVIMTIALGGIASFIGAGGLGVAIWRGITTNFTEMTIAGSLLVAGFAIIADFFIGLAEKAVRKKYIGIEETGGFLDEYKI